MKPDARIEGALQAVLAGSVVPPAPPGLAAAMRDAVFPGGARVRPRLCLSVAGACGDDQPRIAEAAASAIELLHCASLVHDDLPCFDNAALRRGRPAIHVAHGERLAVLTGDALIVLAFEALMPLITAAPERCAGVLRTVGAAVGAPNGIAAGQAWECEPEVPLRHYHRAKTAALFVAAAVAGAQAAGAPAEPWRILGDRLGEAYQVADDLRDVLSNAEETGKPSGQDDANGCPSVVQDLGVEAATARLQRLVGEAMEAVPACPGAERLREGIVAEMHRVVPKHLVLVAA